jgi:hypothetical protein
MRRVDKLDAIFREVKTKSFVSKARKNGLHIPYSNELGNQSLSLWLSDSITTGWLYDTEKDNLWIDSWYNEIFNKG